MTARPKTVGECNLEAQLAALREQSIARHAPFLTRADEAHLMAGAAEVRAREFHSQEMSRRGCWPIGVMDFALTEQANRVDQMFPRGSFA